MPAVREAWVQSLGWKNLPETGMATDTPGFLLENAMDVGAWQATVQRVTESGKQYVI